MKNKKLLAYALLIAGIPSFLLSMLATGYVRDFLEDNVISDITPQHTVLMERVAEKKLLCENYVDEIVTDENILDSFETKNVEALDKQLNPSIKLDSLVFVNTDGTFIYPTDVTVSSEQRMALDLGEAKKEVDPAIRYVSIVERNGNKIGAVEVASKLDGAFVDSFDQQGSELIFADAGEVVAGTIQGSFKTKPGDGLPVKEINNRTINVGGTAYYVEKFELATIGFNRNMIAYIAVKQNIILQLLNSAFVIMLSFAIMIPVTFLTWGLLREMIDIEIKDELEDIKQRHKDDFEDYAVGHPEPDSEKKTN